ARMLARIDEAVAKRENPLVAPLFRDDPRFAREAAYLRGDEQVYREDIRRGEVWVGRLPGEAGEAAALLLREPRSQAFKDWARADRDTPTGRPYALLAVHWGGGEWVFSTDPKHRIRLTSLAEPLTAAEGRGSADPGRAWYDGRHHDGTLVANPDGGTRLDPAAVTRVALRERFGGRRSHTPGGRVINRRAALLVTARAAPLGLPG